jgi:c-di-GMP-binding flagellar brake protein YcgR
MILNIDLDNSELLIDELFPPDNQGSIEAGERIEISSQSRNNPVSFFTRILARKTTDGKDSWLLELPSDIGQNLNRSAFRIYVENEQDLDIEMYHEGVPLPFVRIINISAEGIKLSFTNESEKLLEKNHIFSDCLIRLPNDIDIDCDIDLRSVYSIHTPRPHILGGGKLIIKNPQQLVKLQQYLASIQRRQRRGDNHEI